MPLFKCLRCGCIENTAPAWWWLTEKVCTECKTGRWHGLFPKESAKEMIEGEDGFLYYKEELEPGGYFYGRGKGEEVVE